jgi:hypothetical protein
VEFGNKSFVEKLFFIKDYFEMFTFITDIKNEIVKLAGEVKARFDALEAKLDSKTDTVVADVKADATKVADEAVVAATPAPVVAAVEAIAPKAE